MGFLVSADPLSCVIRSYDGNAPDIADSAYVDRSAVVIGDVTIEADASIWPNATLRSDHGGPIVVRKGANIQDGAVCHEETEIGEYVTVGHCAVIHAAVLEERSLVGMNAVVLDDATVGERAMVGAGSLVREGTTVPSKTLAAGNPAEVKKEVEESPWAHAADGYVQVARKHRDTSEVLHKRWPPEG